MRKVDFSDLKGSELSIGPWSKGREVYNVVQLRMSCKRGVDIAVEAVVGAVEEAIGTGRMD